MSILIFLVEVDTISQSVKMTQSVNGDIWHLASYNQHMPAPSKSIQLKNKAVAICTRVSAYTT